MLAVCKSCVKEAVGRDCREWLAPLCGLMSLAFQLFVVTQTSQLSLYTVVFASLVVFVVFIFQECLTLANM